MGRSSGSVRGGQLDVLREEEQRELLPSHDQLQAVQVGAVQVFVKAVSTELFPHSLTPILFISPLSIRLSHMQYASFVISLLR